MTSNATVKAPVKAIVTDIEGTTSSIDFVHQTLFPYARARMRAYLHAHATQPQVAEQIQAVAQTLLEPQAQVDVDQIADTLEKWIDEDRKATPLKALQGMIWAQGYASGELLGHVYIDTPQYLQRWQAGGLQLYVYSSGSVEAQKLIFGHTEFGDLTPLFSGYFDTRVGAKREVASYQTIAAQIGITPDSLLFLSDIGEELDAARAAGYQTCQLIRDAKAQVFAHHPQARDFSEVSVSSASDGAQ